MTADPDRRGALLEQLLRRIAASRAALAKAHADQDRAKSMLAQLDDNEDPDKIADVRRELAAIDREIEQLDRVLDSFDRGAPITAIASYHAGCLAAQQQAGEPELPLEGRPGGFPDWMWERWEQLTPAEQHEAIQRQREAFTRKN